ncbi:hypothetical protein AALA44_04825 [Enterococcus ratti]|uniref:VirB4-like conjugal transfer ATPase, CD1110 family n=1 Tax=Enterococcus ratti TaxID=150033 RepID=UPI003518C549
MVWLLEREKGIKKNKMNMETNHKKIIRLMKKQKKKRRHYQKKEAPKKNVQEALCYEKMFESGICEVIPNHYSKSIKFSDINYQIAQQEDQVMIFNKYCELLNSLDDTIHLTITLRKKQIDIEEITEKLFYEKRGEHSDIYREEINQMLFQKINQGENRFTKENYLTFTTQANHLEQAQQLLERIEHNLLGNLSELGSIGMKMDGLSRLKMINQLLKSEKNFHFSYADLVYSGLSTKAIIAPSSFNFKKKNYFEIGEEYAQVIYLKDYPAKLTDKLMADLMEIPEEITLSLHIDPINPDKANHLVQTKKAYMEGDKVAAQRKATQKGYDPYTNIPYELTNSINEANLLLDALIKEGQKLFFVSFFLYFRTKKKEKLTDIAEQILSIGRKNGCSFHYLNYLQLEGMNSVLPFGKNWLTTRRTLTTASTAIFLPFTAQELNHKNGKYYGMNELTKNIVRINRKRLNTPSGMILGSSGSGKGVAKKYEEITTLLGNPADEILSIDPEDEDTLIGQAFNAQIVKIAPNTDTFINLLDISDDLSNEVDPVKLKSDFLLTAFEALIGGQSGLNSAQRSIIDRVTRFTYFNYFNSQEKKMPTLAKEWFSLLKSQPEKEAQALALDLELYIEGSLSVFSHTTNIELNKRFIVYNTKQLGSQLKTFGMMVVLEQVWNRVVRNRDRGITTWIYIDEMQLMLSDPYCENYFFELWSRIRKWGAIPTGITQNVETLLLSGKARRMLSNTEFIIMLKQAKSDLDELSSLFRLSAQQQKQLIHPAKGAGLIRAGKAIVPFSNSVDSSTKLYKLMTTDPDDRVKAKMDRFNEKT